MQIDINDTHSRMKVRRKMDSAVRETHQTKRLLEALKETLQKNGIDIGDPSFIFLMDTGKFTLLAG